MHEDLENYIKYAVEDGPVKLVKIHALHGANYFSADQVICMRINLGKYDEVYSNAIEGLYDKLKSKLPSLYEHYCSPSVPGGFFKRVEDGTLLGHIMEHVSIEFQTLAGMDVGYGKTRSTLEQGTYNVIFRFFDEMAGMYAGKAALNMINALVQNKDFDVKDIVANLIDIREKRLLGPSTQAIVQEVEKRKIPFLRLDAYNLVQLGTGAYQKSIRATITSDTNFIAVETAGNKYLTNLILSDAGVPVLKTIKSKNVEEVISFKNKINKPIVIKPSGGYLGKHISTNLNSEEKITEAFKMAIAYDDEVLAQQYHEGASYRLLVIDYKFVAATLLIPPFIIGNGTDSVQTLIDKLNQNPERQVGDKGKLSKVEIDETTMQMIKKYNYNLQSVLKHNEKIFLKYSGNLRLGGTATDVTDSVHPINQFLAERAAKVIGLNVAGIDILSPDISQSMFENKAVVLEVNAAPDFRMHLNPTFNKPRNVAKELVSMLFPANAKSRIPIFSITGTVGKTITAFLLNYCLKNEGYNVGLTTTEGLYITDKKLMKGDMTYPESVALVLKDPTIDCAVLETSLEGIIRRGLGYKFADYGIVLNVQEDHIGNDDIEFIEDVGYAKSVVAEEVFSSGYSVLNADDPLVLEMMTRLYSKPALFSVNKKTNAVLQKHILNGGLAVTLEDDIIKVYNKNQSYDLVSINEIPLFFNKKTLFLSDSVLSAVASLTAFGLQPDKIRKHLTSFKPDFENLPGRMNYIEKADYSILIDYAHNKTSFMALKSFISHLNNPKIGILDAPGDRTDDEIIQLGILAASMFDEIIVYDDIDNRGRMSGEVCSLLIKGLLSQSFDENKIKTAVNHDEAIRAVQAYAHNNNLIVILTAESNICFEQLKKINII